jgi:hypothetical protein
MNCNMQTQLMESPFSRRNILILMVIAFMVISLAGSAVFAKTAGAANEKPNVVLVHGAWADGSG